MSKGKRLTAPATEDQLGCTGFFKWRRNKQGLQLATYYWPVEKPRGVLFLLHGHGSHIEHNYLCPGQPGEPFVYKGSWVEKFNQAGYSACGIDNQSCGRSEGVGGQRAYFDSFDDVVNDTVDFITSVRMGEDYSFNKEKAFLVGGSAGGCVAVHVLHKNPDLCDGAILLAPMLSLENVSSRGLNYYLKPFAAFASHYLPQMSVASTSKNEMFPRVQELYDKDQACWHGPTRARVAHEFLLAADWVVKEMEKMSFPFLCIHSCDDTMCDLDGSKALFVKSKAIDKDLQVIHGMWHVLTQEPGFEDVQARILTWLSQRTTP